MKARATVRAFFYNSHKLKKMKHTTRRVILLTMAALTLWGCNSNENQIRKIAYGYLDAMGNYRIAEAYPYATPETQEGTLRYVEQNIMPLIDSADLFSKETPAKITIKKVTMTSDTTATVEFQKSTPTSEKTNSINLVKRGEQWMVNVILATKPKMIEGGQKHVEYDYSNRQIGTLKRVTDIDTVLKNRQEQQERIDSLLRGE